MPMTIERSSLFNVAQFAGVRERRIKRGTIRNRGKRIEIGLVNNMPDAALQATERQFSDLLNAASGRIDVRLRLYALRDVPRSEDARAALTRTYLDAGQIRANGLDALIVTGAEPLAAELRLEPYWRSLADLIEWADSNTISTVLSCLAAHAGVLHLDGIAREPLDEKCSGVFAFETNPRSDLVAGLGHQILTPHSRRNGLSRRALTHHDYHVLTEDAEIGVDIFVKQRGSLFVFLQGHPEYEHDSLAREYRRDMSRFLRGEQDAPPAIPKNYFAAPVEHAIDLFTHRARRERRLELMAEYPDAAALGPGQTPWRDGAVRLYRNWLDLLVERKATRIADTSRLAVRWGG